MSTSLFSPTLNLASCGGVARENGTYFVNPNHPETTDGTGSCQLTILKMHPEICQIRLDFEQFALAGKLLSMQCIMHGKLKWLLIIISFLPLSLCLPLYFIKVRT